MKARAQAAEPIDDTIDVAAVLNAPLSDLMLAACVIPSAVLHAAYKHISETSPMAGRTRIIESELRRRGDTESFPEVLPNA